MKDRKRVQGNESQSALPDSIPAQNTHGRVFSVPEQGTYLDAIQLGKLEGSYREWVEAASRADVRIARQRILLIFLLIRYTGAKLSDVLHLDPEQDIDFEQKSVTFGRSAEGPTRARRTVQLSEVLCRELRTIMDGPLKDASSKNLLQVDPGFVRKKFYERAESCGIAKQLGAPESLRKSRGIELMQNNMPLPAVQALLGHSTPNLTSSYMSFSHDDIQQVIGHFMEKESARKTSARNSFFGKIQTIRKGDIQVQIVLVTMGGYPITTVITENSFHRLGLKAGKLVTAEVKAPWITLQKSGEKITNSSDNMLNGIVESINHGEIISEFVVRLGDGTAVCSIVTRGSSERLALVEGDEVVAMFNAHSVVLLSD